MITLDDWRALTPGQRAPWVAFHQAHIANNPADPYLAMAYGRRFQLVRFAINAANDALAFGIEYQWPAIPWIQNDPFYLPDPTTTLRVPFPMPATDAIASAHLQGTGPIPQKIRPRRSYDTGICRRRRNYKGP